MEINEKDFAVIREISNNAAADQRAIAARSGISLGMTNLIIKRLTNMGYIKAKQLDKKKIQYLLTPQGFAEKARKSYAYTRRTIGLFKTTKEKIRDLILEEHRKGAVRFIIEGNSEVADIAASAIASLHHSGIILQRRDDINSESSHLIVSNAEGTCSSSIDLLEFLSMSGVFF